MGGSVTTSVVIGQNLSAIVQEIQFGPARSIQGRFSGDAAAESANILRSAAEDTVERARKGSTGALTELHLALESIHRSYFTKPRPNESWCNRKGILDPVQAILEDFVIEYEDQWMDEGQIPFTDDPDQFVQQLKEAVRAHPANRHPFYIDFLPFKAGVADIRYYLAQETALDPRFDDFIALMQLGCDSQQKLELAGNYWDEMGNGNAAQVHTSMFENAMREVGADPEFVNTHRLVETLICGNLSATLAVNPRFYYRSIGSFAVTEFLFPRRCAQLLEAWRRNNLSERNGDYHKEHIGIDARHASGFFRNVIKPEIRKDPSATGDIYWGAIARMNSSQRYLDALLNELVSC